MSFRKYLQISYKLGLSKRLIWQVFILTLIATLFESAGLVMIVPIYQYVEAGGNISSLATSHEKWQWIVAICDTLNLEPTISILALFAVLMVLFRQVASYVRLIAVASAREQLKYCIKERIFSHFLSSTLQKQDQSSKGEVVNDLTLELYRFGVSLLGVVNLASAATLTCIYGAFLINISWQMFLVSTITIGGGLFPVKYLYAKMREAGRASTAANNEAGRFLIEKLQASRLIRLAGIETAEKRNMEAFAAKQQMAMMRVERLMAAIAVSVEPIVLTLALVLLVVSIDVLHLQLESLGLFLLIILRLMPVAKDFMKARQLMASCAGSAEALYNRVKDLESNREIDAGDKLFTKLSSQIAFDNVEFRYDNDGIPALRRINLSIPAKGMTAIIGPSGSGKSTLIDLLPRLRQPTAGTITIDGNDIRDFTTQSLRDSISYVPQAPQIFDAPLIEHIRLGKSDASMDVIEDAARLSGAAEFIDRLPEGYNTRIGEKGGRLSGGQRQRLDLARAIVRNAPILILDEPTSSLDPQSERAFVEALKRINKERQTTIIVVAHRLSTIQDADLIVVLNNGRIEATGTHAEILETSAWYRSLSAPDSPVVQPQTQSN